MPESVHFMISRTGRKDEESDESLHSLVNELGGLPLALKQAAAHIKILKCTFKEYLDKFIIKRLKLLKASNLSYEIPKERQAVRTTWQLNFEYIEKQSNTEGLGSAAVSVMEILAFLYADEIPVAVLNTGSPKVTAEDLLDGLQDCLGIKQTVEILTRFSLFQWSSSDTISLHRLVQEVIRENINDFEHKRNILQDAARMINKAIEKTHTICEVLESKNTGRMSLQIWNKLALHASTLKEHIFEFTRSNPEFTSVCFNVETCNILQASAIYHSLYQRQDEALACQDQMLSIVAALDISQEHYQNLTRIKIPLLSRERAIIQGCLAVAFGSSSAFSGEETSLELLDPETLRQKGNEYFKMKKFNESIQCYSEAISIRNEDMDPTLLSNRSLAYFKIGDFNKALRDADKCIQLNPMAWKAYCWKAYAIASLIRLGHLPKVWESVGLAAAAVAGHLNEQCMFEYRMKMEYPVLRYKIVENERQFESELNSLHTTTYTALLLRQGCYKMPYTIITKSIQIIGIDNKIEIVCAYPLQLAKPSSAWLKVEDQINIHFENVCFPSGSAQVIVGKDVQVLFYRCKFSNGRKGCTGFPDCEGGIGCVNPNGSECRQMTSMKNKPVRTGRMPSGVDGYAGIAACHGGKVFVESCTLDRCGGGGTVCEDEGSFISLQNSIIKNMIQMGVEARHGGRVQIENCAILDNQFHGVTIGPRGYGTIRNCTIQGNKEEGIWCGGTLETGTGQSGKPIGGSICEIKDNLICQNGMCGISLDGGSFDISGNKVFENWFWGLLLKSRSTAYISNNDIFENKCGGIRIGINYSSSVILHGNSVRDHTGPGLHTLILDISTSPQHLTSNKSFGELLKGHDVPKDEITSYSIQPIVTTMNVFKDNDKGLQHPKQIHTLVQTCCFCHNVSGNLKLCTKCRKASYCSKQCQRGHWGRHKFICCLLHQTYTIELELSKTQTPEEMMGIFSMFRKVNTLNPETDSEQGKGEPPDKTGKTKFIVKIESGAEYTRYDPHKQMNMYDQTRTFEVWFSHPQIYHLVCECGVLGPEYFTTKRIYCWASFKDNGKKLCIFTENLPPLQQW